MELFVVKSTDGYARFPADGQVQWVGLEKASVFGSMEECEEKLGSVQNGGSYTNLRMSKLLIEELDWMK